eukprot:16021-Heterococcus_DN1.PRE.3
MDNCYRQPGRQRAPNSLEVLNSMQGQGEQGGTGLVYRLFEVACAEPLAAGVATISYVLGWCLSYTCKPHCRTSHAFREVGLVVQAIVLSQQRLLLYEL